MQYFECNLPLIAPAYMRFDLAQEFEAASRKIHVRHETLNNALELVKSKMKPETFQELMAALFASEYKKQKTSMYFDSLTPEQLATYACIAFHGDVNYTRFEFDRSKSRVLFDIAFALTKEWEATRHLGVGGSDAPVVIGVSPYKTRWGFYNDKVGKEKKINFDEGKQSIFDRGHDLETNVIETFASITGATVIPETRMFQNIQYPHCIADIDTMLQMPDGSYYIGEAKSATYSSQDKWEKGKVPPYYIPQCRHYMSVLDDDRICGVYIACVFTQDLTLCGKYLGANYKPDNFQSQMIERDNMLESEQREQIETFWTDYVEEEVEPPHDFIDAHNVTINEIRAYAGPVDPTLDPVDLNTQSNIELCKKWLDIEEKKASKDKEVKELEKQSKAIKAQFEAQLGQAKKGTLTIDDKNYEISYVVQSKTSVDIERLEILSPEIAKQVIVSKPESTKYLRLSKAKPVLKTP